MWNVYIMEVINSSKNHRGEIEFYTGIAYSPTDGLKDVARNIVRRFNEHRLRYKSNWMKNTKKIPRRIVYVGDGFKRKSDAEQREKQIKNKGRSYKIELAQSFYLEKPVTADWLDKYFSRYGRFCY